MLFIRTASDLGSSLPKSCEPSALDSRTLSGGTSDYSHWHGIPAIVPLWEGPNNGRTYLTRIHAEGEPFKMLWRPPFKHVLRTYDRCSPSFNGRIQWAIVVRMFI